MNTNPSFRERLSTGEPVIGPWCVIPAVSGAIAIASSGMDFAIIDMEHGAFDVDSMNAYIHALRSRDCAALVRPSGGIDENRIQTALDAGADGLVIPSICSVEDAERVRDASRYPPIGRRGFSPFTPAGSRFGQRGPEYREAANQLVAVIGILESEQAVDALEEIASVGAFDALYIGAYDLSSALGFDGDVYNPEFRQLFLGIVERAKACGLALGGFVARTPEDVEWLQRAGISMITCEVDIAALMTTYARLSEATERP